MSFMSFILNAVKDDRAYESMLAAAQKRLSGRDPMEIAARSAMPFETLKGYFYWPSLGDTVKVDPRDWSVTGCRGNWHVLTVLHYLDMADGAPLTGRMITFGQQKDGLARGGDFDRRCESLLGKELGRLDLKEAERRCLRLGGRLVSSNADLCAEFAWMPRYPVTLKLWLADEDLDGSARLFLDESCSHYLSIEDSVTVGTILTEELLKP